MLHSASYQAQYSYSASLNYHQRFVSVRNFKGKFASFPIIQDLKC